MGFLFTIFKSEIFIFRAPVSALRSQSFFGYLRFAPFPKKRISTQVGAQTSHFFRSGSKKTFQFGAEMLWVYFKVEHFSA
jgi:hypothetical protein